MTVADLVDRATDGDRRALGRLLTIAERGGEPATELAGRLQERRRPARVVGITGAPGAGKSTLTGSLLTVLTHSGGRVGVLAVDPSSPLTGGAILGDRVRMGQDDEHSGTFIRSVATRGSRGGLAAAVPAMIRVLESAHYDTVLIETVGVGQVELDIAALADTTVVVVTPGWGDAIQANKAGLLEVADVFVVNKADRPGATDAVRDLEYMLELSSLHDGWRAPIVRTVATDGTGVDDLLGAIDDHARSTAASGSVDVSRRTTAELRAHVEHATRRAIDATLADRADLLTAIEAGELTPDAVTRQVLAAVADAIRSP